MANASLSARVYDQVLARLLSGRWGPGHVFNRRQVAEELGVSVAPVLEAMLELRAEGLIETLPRRGTRVRTPTLADVQGQLIVREALECQAARLYCGEPIERHAPRLVRLAEQVDAARLHAVAHLKDEVRFHHYLVSLAGVPALTEAFERVMKAGLLYAVQVLHPSHESAPRRSHVELVRALAAADPDAAEAAIRAHARSGKEALFVEQREPAADDAPRTPASPVSPAWLRA